MWTPVIVLMVFSVNNSKYDVAWQGFTLKWYNALLHDTKTLHAFQVSIIVAVVTIFISVVIGTLTAYGLYKYRFRGKDALRSVLILPLNMPGVVVGVAMLLYFKRLIHMPLGYASIIITHVAFSIPLVTFIVLARMQRIDWTLEEAAMDLGANRFTTMRKITVPLLMPGILGAVLLNFPWSFNDFVITYFVVGIGTTTLPIRIYSMIRRGVSPVINALGTLLILGTILLVVIAILVQRQKPKETSGKRVGENGMTSVQE
jgi:spermidine/putrescine transport system permease protein